jgi:hypothetical protein
MAGRAQKAPRRASGGRSVRFAVLDGTQAGQAKINALKLLEKLRHAQAREGQFVLKYFLLRKAARVRAGQGSKRPRKQR